MALTRRHFIAISGTSAVVVAAGAGAFAVTREPTEALRPWQAAADFNEDPRIRALSYAILAPNPHNRQPWLVELDGASDVVLYCDESRLLPHTDPFSRQIVIGLGCFLEILVQAAAEQGYRAIVESFPAGEPTEHLDDRPIARIRFDAEGGIARDPLFQHVLARRSNKAPFDNTRAVAAADLDAIARAARTDVEIASTNDTADVAALRDATWRAHVIESTTPRTYMESVHLMRIGKAEIEANPDGIDLGGPLLETLNLLGLLTREQLADPGSSAFAQGMEMYGEIIGSAMAYIWIATAGNTRTDQLSAGRSYVRLNLSATSMGLGMHPLSQALQEYPEMAELGAEVDRRLGVDRPGRVQMLARVGYGAPTDPSPRWPLASRIIRSGTPRG